MTSCQAAVFIAVDHFTAACVGIHAAKRGTRFEALEPVRQGVQARFGAIGKDVAAGLSLRHDHGTQYMFHDFRNEIRWPGLTSSPAFVRAPEGNGCAERVRHCLSDQWRSNGSLRTLKENLLWVSTFNTVEDLRQALLAFQRRYNEDWLIERHGYRSPAQFRRDLEAAIPAAA